MMMMMYGKMQTAIYEHMKRPILNVIDWNPFIFQKHKNDFNKLIK